MPILVLDRLPGSLIGLSLGVAILVRRDYAYDLPTLMHELEHCKQFWQRGLFVHWFKYALNRGYRLRAELEAFSAELRACPPALLAQRLDDAARALALGYRIGHSIPDCQYMLRAHVHTILASDD